MTPSRAEAELEQLRADGFVAVHTDGEESWTVAAPAEMFRRNARLYEQLKERMVFFRVGLGTGAYPRATPVVSIISPPLRSSMLPPPQPLQTIREPNPPQWLADTIRISSILKNKVYYLCSLGDVDA